MKHPQLLEATSVPQKLWSCDCRNSHPGGWFFAEVHRSSHPDENVARRDLVMMLSLTGWVSRGLVLFAMVLTTASITTSGEWGEDGVTYAELGSDVVLTCPGANASSLSRWQRNGGSGLPTDSKVQQGQLLLSHVDLSSEGTYSCQDGGGLLLGSVALRVGRLPGPPSVSCRASNYENFSCFWTPSIETHLPTRYITSYLTKQLPGSDKSSRSPVIRVGPCVQDPGLPLSCTVGKSQFWSSYRVNVTEVNPLGSSFALLDIIAHSITKPDPPERVRVEPVPLAPRRLRVSWEYPSSWPKEPSFQLHFRLRYRPLLHNSWSMVETSNVSEVITDAVMGLEHTVQVSAKDFLDAGSWSEWSPEARGWPAAGQVAEPSEAAPDTVELDPPAEEPSPAPDNKPVAGHGDSMEMVAMLVSLGVFAFFALVALLLFAFLVWIRAKKQSKEADKHQELLSAATHLKALPKGQIL
ncbi:interleukin-11 receptor subunit alpha isoform X4 [Pantherophis guttatus]|uniref:Interleukin-11 receptor subunit alpha isoform X4 n=1 Tax=Pantherophis guttatus TaxID=94885 RepID=A0ABM3YWB9_PANGU|nr:interleukin-11 receptor subunit alpha isoform X4 [Pantherophis guttatus]